MYRLRDLRYNIFTKLIIYQPSIEIPKENFLVFKICKNVVLKAKNLSPKTPILNYFFNNKFYGTLGVIK